MNSRLDALLRQRALIKEHAQWLDDEIEAERARPGSTHAPLASATVPRPPEPNRAPSEMVPSALPEPDIKQLHTDVRRGCLFYVLIAIAAGGALIGFIYWKYRSSPDAPSGAAVPAGVVPDSTPTEAPRLH